MKFIREVKSYDFGEGIKVGDIVMLENTLSCDSFYAKILSVETAGVKIIKINTGDVKILSFAECQKYDVKHAKLSVDNMKETMATQDNIHNEAEKELIKPYREVSKVEAERALDAYEKMLRAMLIPRRSVIV